MKRIIGTMMAALIISFGALGQDNTEDLKKQKFESMNKLSFMLGTWNGTGWIQMGGNAPRETFVIDETIQKKLDGLVYLVEGHGTSNGKTTHKALAIISWDIENMNYGFESHTSDGRSMGAVGKLEGSSFIWGFEAPNGAHIRYTMDFSDPSKWHETGAYSPDGTTWYPFMEMILTKID